MIGAAEALAWGLADRVVPAAELQKAAMALAGELASGATAAIAIAKAAIADGLDLPLVDGLRVEAAAFTEVFATEDAEEGVDAFVGKRPPRFSGR